jgi:hypothetical protein
MIELRRLVEWLGPEGARSGLRDSHIPLKDLVELARMRGLPLQPKPTRDEVANELAYENVKKIDKSLDELLEMAAGDLLGYLEKIRPTIRELLDFLEQLGIRPGSEDRKHLIRFTAREISDTGMYQRVARGAAREPARRP